MKLSKRLPVIGACLGAMLSVSCTPPANNATTQVVNDPYKNEIAFEGPIVVLEHDTSLIGTPMGTEKDCYLRGWKNKTTGVVANQLYMVVRYDGSGWRYYRSATLIGGVPLPFMSIDRQRWNCNHERSACIYREDFAVVLSESQLRALALSGVTVEVQSKAGKDDIFSVSPEYVRNYLATVAGRSESE